MSQEPGARSRLIEFMRDRALWQQVVGGLIVLVLVALVGWIGSLIAGGGRSATHDADGEASLPPPIPVTNSAFLSASEAPSASVAPSHSIPDPPMPSPRLSPSSSTAVSPAPRPPTLQTVFLADRGRVDEEIRGRTGQCTGGCAGFGTGPGTTGGHSYANSFLMRVDSQGNLSSATWNFARSCTTIEARVGSRDDTPARMHLSLRIDGRLVDLGTVAPGDSTSVRRSVRGAALVELDASVVTATGDYHDLYVVWGDVRATCRSGSFTSG